MKYFIILICYLLSACGTSYKIQLYDATIPPVIYQKDNESFIIFTENPDKKCKEYFKNTSKKILGCYIYEINTIIVNNPCKPVKDAVLCHELGHLNGGKHDKKSNWITKED